MSAQSTIPLLYAAPAAAYDAYAASRLTRAHALIDRFEALTGAHAHPARTRRKASPIDRERVSA